MSNSKNFGDSGVWRGWRELSGDINWEDYGGKWGFQDPSNPSVFYVIKHDNMMEYMGEDEIKENGIDIHVSNVMRVDLSEVPESELASAFECCGFDPDECELSASNLDWAKVECLVDYGVAAPMGEHSDPSYPERARAAARREVAELIADSAKCNAKLDRPVNAIGSTARDFGQGNIMAGLDRYKIEQQTRALKVNMKRVPSDDPIAFTHGFQTGCAGGPFPADEDDLAPEWIKGHELGLMVRDGKEDIRELNTWVKPDTSNAAMDLMARLQG